MPKVLSLIAIFILLQSATVCKAQQMPLPKPDTVNKKDSIYKALFNRRGKTVFGEFLGTAGAYSLNFDVRSGKKQNGMGARIGLSYFANSYGRAFTAPLMLNWLIGKRSHYFEVGAGATFYHFESDNPYHRFFIKDIYIPIDGDPYDQPSTNGVTENGAIFAVSAGYRYQPLKGGLTYRIGLSPVFSSQRLLPFWPYASVGYAFKKRKAIKLVK